MPWSRCACGRAGDGGRAGAGARRRPGRAADVPAGRRVILQRPPTTHGVAFVTIEDEHALGNLVFSPAASRRCREALHAAPLLLTTGWVQRKGSVVNVQATSVEPWWPEQRQRRPRPACARRAARSLQ
jgi:error-prone DNA polymerase